MENRVEEEEWKIVEMTTRIKVINFTYGSYFSFLARFGYIYIYVCVWTLFIMTDKGSIDIFKGIYILTLFTIKEIYRYND